MCHYFKMYLLFIIHAQFNIYIIIEFKLNLIPYHAYAYDTVKNRKIYNISTVWNNIATEILYT